MFHHRWLPPLDRLPSATYDPIKGALRAPPLSTASIPALISPPRARNHLPIEAPPAASVERYRVAISTAPSPSGAMGENPDDLLSL
jgi:hypothetical protein